jgi:serine/threonine-protein kinase
MSLASPMSESRVPEIPDLTNLAGIKLGNYRLERLVGRGRMGAVYLAQDEALLRPTAIKILSWSVAEAQGQDPVQWFLAEARLVARINHPRVVQIYGAAKHGDHCYIAMEYVAGQSAEAAVAQGGPMGPEAATDVLLQVASALHAAHRSGVIHRDVKPANLLVGAGGVIKLGDFGMALGFADLRTGNAHLRVGTPYYTAPEIWRGEAASAASDIYALGATYFQLLTGRPPYPGRDIATVEQAHLRAAIPDPRELAPRLPASCAALVKRALAKGLRERHASAQELLWEGRRVLQDLSPAAGLASAGPHRAPERAAPAAERAAPAAERAAPAAERAAPAAERAAPAAERAAPAAERAAPAGPQRSERVPAPARQGDPAARPPVPPPTAWEEGLGFVRRPFSEVDPVACPYLGEPFAAARDRILKAVEDDATTALALVGAGGSGRTVLCRQIAAELGGSRLVLYVDVVREAGRRSLLQRICRAAGVVEGSSEDESLDALTVLLGEERQQQRNPPLLVLDGVAAAHPSTAGLARIVGAGLWTRSFKLLLTGGAGLVDELTRGGVDFHGEQVPEIPLPPLDREQSSRYVRGWLEATLASQAPRVIVSPDALLLVALRTGGALARINCIAENMLMLAAAEQGRMLSSWHAWAASDRERWSGSQALAALPRRPEQWPPPEVVDVIDACRRGAGMPPWPREADRQEQPGRTQEPGGHSSADD